MNEANITFSCSLPTSGDSPWYIWSNSVVILVCEEENQRRVRVSRTLKARFLPRLQSICSILYFSFQPVLFASVFVVVNYEPRGGVSRCARENILQMVEAPPAQFALCLATHDVCCLTLIWRLNTKLESNGYPPMSSLVQDLSDGVKLIQLMVSRYLAAHCSLVAHNSTVGNHG